jgi:hypothetical protein
VDWVGCVGSRRNFQAQDLVKLTGRNMPGPGGSGALGRGRWWMGAVVDGGGGGWGRGCGLAQDYRPGANSMIGKSRSDDWGKFGLWLLFLVGRRSACTCVRSRTRVVGERSEEEVVEAAGGLGSRDAAGAGPDSRGRMLSRRSARRRYERLWKQRMSGKRGNWVAGESGPLQSLCCVKAMRPAIESVNRTRRPVSAIRSQREEPGSANANETDDSKLQAVR